MTSPPVHNQDRWPLNDDGPPFPPIAGGMNGPLGAAGGDRNRRISTTIKPERKISVVIIDALHGISPERKISNALGLKQDDGVMQYNLLQNDAVQAGRRSEDGDSDEFDEEDEEEEEEEERRIGGDSMDEDVIDDDDIEARQVCCGEARLNCGRFTTQMGKEWREVREHAKKCDCKKFIKGYFSMDVLKRRLPILQWAPKYRMAEFQGDLIAGCTVGMTVIPQAIAYALIANVPPQYGLYSAFIGSFVYVIFGSAKDICLGPSAVSSLLTALFATSPLGPTDPSIAILLAFLVGFIYLGMFIFSLGFITDFFSFPVMKAFVVAAAITIAATQVKKWFGLTKLPSDFMGQFNATLKRIPETRLWDFLMGVCCIALIVFLKKLKEIKWKGRFSQMPLWKRIINKTLWFLGTGRNIVALILASVTAYLFLNNGVKPFTLTGYIPPGIPAFGMPNLTIYDPKTNITHSLGDISGSIIGVGFIIVPLLGILEALSIGNIFARRFNYRIDVNQEFLAYGIGNVLTGLFSGYPICGTFSRTALNAQSGVKTQAGGIYTGAIVLLALKFLTPLFYYIPTASLAVVIILAVIDMVTFQKLWIFWKTRKIDLIPWIVTLVLSFVINIAYGVIIGAGLSLLLLLYPATRPRIKKLKHDAPTLLNCSHIHPDGSSVVLVTFNSHLMFPSIEYLKDKLIPIYSTTEELPKGVILDFQHVSIADTTTVQGLRLMMEIFHKKGIPLVIAQMRKSAEALFTKSKPKFFLKTKTIEEAVALIYGLRANNVSMNGNLSQSCMGLEETCPWIPRSKKEKKKQQRLALTGQENPGFVGAEEEVNHNAVGKGVPQHGFTMENTLLGAADEDGLHVHTRAHMEQIPESPLAPPPDFVHHTHPITQDPMLPLGRNTGDDSNNRLSSTPV